MKAIQILLFCLSAVPAFSQNYHPFIQYGTYRDEFWAPELQFCYYSYGHRYWFRGDTALGGQPYQILWRAGIQRAPGAPDFCPPYQVDTNDCGIFALMREDLVEKKVFQYDFETNTEFLLFDFSAAVGDSVTVGNPPETVYIANEWATTWADGSNRRNLIVIVPLGAETMWIESLGASNNLWDPLSELCICPHSICYQQNGQSLYGDQCATAVRADEPAILPENVSLSPNPTRETLLVQLEGGQKPFDGLTIFDLPGRVVAEQRFASELFSADVSVRHLPPGIYLLVLSQGEKRLSRQRFQKI